MKGYFAHLRRYSWVVLACSLVALGAGALVARTQPPTYQATSTLLVQAGAPGTTYPGGTAATFTAADNLNLATDYAAEIPTRVVMQYVIKSDPQLQKDQYTPDQLILDVLPSTAKTTPTITLLVTAAHPKNAVLLANDMALGFADYIRSLNQQSLDSLRTSLTDQIGLYRQQKASWEARIAALPNTTVPQYTVYTNELLDTTNILDSLQTRLQALPFTVRGYVSVVELAAPSDVTATSRGTIPVRASMIKCASEPITSSFSNCRSSGSELEDASTSGRSWAPPEAAPAPTTVIRKFRRVGEQTPAIAVRAGG